MKIGVIGAGHISMTVGRLWAKAGHEFRFGVRHPEAVEKEVAELGSKAAVGSAQEAARFGELVFAAVPFGAWPELARQIGRDLEGKVLADAANPYASRDGKMADDAIAAGGTGIFYAKLLPKVRVVRAFNTINYKILAAEAYRRGDRLAVPIAGDDKEALNIVAGLVRDAGFEPVIVGPLKDAQRLDVGAPAYGAALTARELREKLGLKQPVG